MAIALSSQFMSNLVGLTSINDDMSTVQTRLATGKKVSSALDDPAVYFRAKGMQEKSDAYDAVNAGINAGLKNVELANKGLDTMYSNLQGLLTQLNDAKSKSIAATANVSTANGVNYGSSTSSLLAVNGTSTNSATAAAGDSTKFQVGDRFSISYKQADGTTRTRYFEASATAGTGTQTGIATTVNNVYNANAITFNTVADLQQAVKNAFGNTDVTLTVNASGQMSLGTTEAGTSLILAQTVDAAVADPGATGTTLSTALNSKLDFTRIFGSSANTAVQSGNGASAFNDPNNAAVLGSMITYTGTGNAASAANLETRRQAADSYRVTLQQLNNISRDSYMPGMVNLLAGTSATASNTMLIDLNENAGDVQQRVSIGGAVDPANLGFTGFNATTGNDSQSGTNFSDDTTIGNAATRVSAAMSTIRIRQAALSVHSNMLSTRLDFNKSFQKMLSASANELTAADSAEEAGKMAAAQNRQSFATNNLSVTKQAEQSLLQLLR